ncbi:hypothetical protein NPIL_159911 [Nephila pilipes]|uniref:Uncharacterized protein n=1 Tax=Nephila pilipes TaxID=299642 RepID=A0A8X6NMD7_NEPPI|nr:hypothetical protein NPIL_159911 [Nephila pilipes]
MADYMCPEFADMHLGGLPNRPWTSVPLVVAELDVLHMVVWNILHTTKMYPFYIQMVQPFNEDDYPSLEQLVCWMCDVTKHYNPQFSAAILFTNKASVTLEGVLPAISSVVNDLITDNDDISFQGERKVTITFTSDSKKPVMR